MKDSTLRSYRRWVLAAGVYNILFGLPLAIPALYKKNYQSSNKTNNLLHLGGESSTPPREGINKLFVNLFGMVLCIVGLNLIYASRDLRNRTGIPVINILGRTFGSLLIWYYTINNNIVRIMAVLSVVDMAFASAFIYYATKLRGFSPRRWLG